MSVHRFRRPAPRRGGLGRGFLRLLVLTFALTFIAVFQTHDLARADGRRTLMDGPGFAYYPNCAAARWAGVAPIYRGEPGYRPELDADNDGIACEPYPNRRW